MNKNHDLEFDPIKRFSDRVESYVKYRPGYPEEILPGLESECGLSNEHIIADIGSGTGILSEMFLKSGYTVWGVEPNYEMRAAAEKLLAKYAQFTSIDGRAESTTLQNHSVDFITAAQAFHWFQQSATYVEFLRILKPNQWVVLLWNDRKTDSAQFLQNYEILLLEYGVDYKKVDHNNIEEEFFTNFWQQGHFRQKIFENSQVLDYPALKGRLLSSSYAPAAGHPDHDSMLKQLKQLFDEFEVDGHVTIDYDTKMYFGQLS
ncbi:MAG: class I SAM-dependent methyltransferase [bacterium]